MIDLVVNRADNSPLQGIIKGFKGATRVLEDIKCTSNAHLSTLFS